MNKRMVFKHFLKDKALLTLLFFLSSLCILLFCSLSAGEGIGLAYPLILTLFLYLILMLVEWFRYYRFHLQLAQNLTNIHIDLQPSTEEQKEVSRLVQELHSHYINHINEIRNNHQSQKHLLSQWIHNMKTPVSVIDLILQKGTADSVEIAEGSIENFRLLLEDIGEENAKLANQLEQVLNLLRLDDFASDYVPEVVNLAAAVKKVINSRKSQFIYANVFPKIQFDQEQIAVLSDAKWNEVLLEQIVSNAIKYSQTLGESKSVYFNIHSAGDRTVLEVRDEGIGIPPSDLGRVFEPFFTGENGRKFKNASGIGLYISSVISEKLGHSLTIHSEVDQGTTVRISYLSKV